MLICKALGLLLAATTLTQARPLGGGAGGPGFGPGPGAGPFAHPGPRAGFPGVGDALAAAVAAATGAVGFSGPPRGHRPAAGARGPLDPAPAPLPAAHAPAPPLVQPFAAAPALPAGFRQPLGEPQPLGPPQPYNFQYAVNDAQTGAAFTRQEGSDGQKVTGAYSVQLPDGREQIVRYNADGGGFNAEVEYQGEPHYPPAAAPRLPGGGGVVGGRSGGPQHLFQPLPGDGGPAAFPPSPPGVPLSPGELDHVGNGGAAAAAFGDNAIAAGPVAAPHRAHGYGR